MGVVSFTVSAALCTLILSASIISLRYCTSTFPTGVIDMASVPDLPPVPPRKVRASNSLNTSASTGSSIHIRFAVAEAKPSPWLAVLIRMMEPFLKRTTGASPLKPFPGTYSISGCNSSLGTISHSFPCMVLLCSCE